MSRLAHRIRHRHDPEPIIANFTPYACRICSAAEIENRARRQLAMEHEIADWNAHALQIIREREADA
jgi:hypothetical protein